jgi:tetratricopeptide (TPR) repeat protein
LWRVTSSLFVAALLATAGCASPQLKLNWAGNEALAEHDYRLAAERYQQSLAEAEKVGDEQLAASALYGLGRANGYMCNFPEAEKFFAESIDRREHLPDTEDAYLTQNLCEFGRLYLAEGKWEDAAAQFKRAVPRLEALGTGSRDPIGYAEALEDYEKALRNAGRPDEAAKVSQRSADLRRENPSRTADYKFRPYPSHCDSE